MEKANEENSNPASSPEQAPAPKRRRRCSICKLVTASILIVVVVYVVFGADPDYGQYKLLHGKWVPDPSGPLYNDTTCNFIDVADNCINNGRPDLNYLYWRWQPYHSDLPPFDPVVFMKAMRNKTWALIGDSILRNQMQSLVCLVSKIEEPIEIYHDKAYKSRTVHFPNHNFTIATVWAPFLVKYEIFENNTGQDNKGIHLHIDTLADIWTSDYHKYDYIIISGGQWFLKTLTIWDNGKVIGCHDCTKERNLNELGVEFPYRKVLQRVFKFIASSDHKPLVFFRTWTPDHFEHGEWYSGGVCNRTEPYKEGQFNGRAVDHSLLKVELEEYKKARDAAAKKGVKIELLDIYQLSLLRPDGHPGPYRKPHPFDKGPRVQNDCLHWCLPGPVDTWNELMMKTMLNIGALNSSILYDRAIEGVELVSSL